MGAAVGTYLTNILPHSNGIYMLVSSVRHFRSRFQTLRLTENEVSHLYSIYKGADLSQKNCVKTAHLMTFLKIEDTPFAKRMLRAFDAGARFEAFVFEIWNICTIDESDLGEFELN